MNAAALPPRGSRIQMLLREVYGWLDLFQLQVVGGGAPPHLHELFRICARHGSRSDPFLLSWTLLEAMACAAVLQIRSGSAEGALLPPAGSGALRPDNAIPAGPAGSWWLDDRPGADFMKIRLRVSTAGEMRRKNIRESAIGLHSHYAPLRLVELMTACR